MHKDSSLKYKIFYHSFILLFIFFYKYLKEVIWIFVLIISITENVINISTNLYQYKYIDYYIICIIVSICNSYIIKKLDLSIKYLKLYIIIK